MKWMSFGFLAVAVVFCGAWRGHPWVYPVVNAVPYVADGAIRTTADDPILLRQRMQHGPFVRLDRPIEVVRGSKTYAVSTDNLLFAADTSGRRVFCTYDVTYSGRNSLGISARGRTCLEDADVDGQLDGIAWVSVSDFSRNIVQFSADIEPAVSYSAASHEAPPSIEFAIKYVREADGPTLQIMYVDGVFENALDQAPVAVPANLPATLSVQGARFEIISLESDVLTYRVLNGLDSNTPVTIDLPRF